MSSFTARRNQRFAQKRARLTRAGTPAGESRSSLWQQALRMRGAGGGAAVAGVQVNERTAMNLAAVFCSVRTLADAKALLPIDVYERRGTGLKDAKVSQHPLTHILSTEPNPDQTPFVFNEQRQAHVLLWGNNYAELVFDPRTSDVIEAIPRSPDSVEVLRDQRDLDERGRPRLKYARPRAALHAR